MGYPLLYKALRRENGYLFILKVQLAALRNKHAGNYLGKLALTVAVHARYAHYLASSNGEADSVEAVMLGSLAVIHVSERYYRFPRLLDLFIMGGGKLPAYHKVRKLLAGSLVPVEGTYAPARPEYGYAVGYMQHLAHLMAYEYYALSLGGKLVHYLEQPFHLYVRQRGRGLVQHQQLCAPVQRLEYLYPLLSAYRYLGYGLIQLHLKALLIRQLLYFPAAGVLVYEYALCIAVAQYYIFQHRHGLHQHKMLMYHAYALLYRLCR